MFNIDLWLVVPLEHYDQGEKNVQSLDEVVLHDSGHDDDSDKRECQPAVTAAATGTLTVRKMKRMLI
jgi:hypothetical protein